MRTVFLLLVCAAACGRGDVKHAAAVDSLESDEAFHVLAPGASAKEILLAVSEGLRTREKGPKYVRFVVIRAADRHPPEGRNRGFHVLVGAGVKMPAGALRIRREWVASGRIDGDNAELETLGLSLAVEGGAPRPYGPEVVSAVAGFCEALAMLVPVHPDCVVAMGEVPYTNLHAADADEKTLARAARDRVPVPPTDGTFRIRRADGNELKGTFETRDDEVTGIRVGMMMRKRFDGENRGMLFVYRHRAYRHFWMRNCFIPIDVAYIRENRIEQIVTMQPAAGKRQKKMRYYPSNAAVRYALEMPSGWFASHGVSARDEIFIQR